MKTSSFIAGLALGAAAAVAITKKMKLSCCGCDDAGKTENPALKDAENAVETLRSSVESLRKELNTRIESEQTYAAQCEDLKDQVAKKDVEIGNLKNICEKQDGVNKKLEEELEEARAK
ncbi:MAG: hypothetical protein MJY98_05075 [Fibrobacter sp.]|nr:hypothetical protein [Fibrobacter sp.]